jgi:Uma2 family endonuclease
MSLAAAKIGEKDQEVFYPCSDGQPMAETTLHIRAIILLLQALQDFFQHAAEIFVAADLFWYWEEGNPNSRKAPDVMVVKGVEKRERRSFFSWLENHAIPCVLFEIASQSTWREDLYEKRRLYAQLGVQEYFLFDPEAQYLRPALQGFRRNEQGLYAPLEPDAEDRLKSEELGLFLRAEGAMVRLLDVTTGQPVLTKDERIAQLQRLLEQAQGRQAP